MEPEIGIHTKAKVGIGKHEPQETIVDNWSNNGEILRWNAERTAAGGIWLLIVYTAVKNLFAAKSQPFWYDELLTVAVAHQPNLGAVWTALTRAKDSSPPLYILFEHLCGVLVPNEQVAYRLPSIIGFGCIMWCLFIFVRKRSGSICAFLCALIPILTPLYKRYAVEARSYCLVVACISIALVCYQRVLRRSWPIYLGLALAGAEAFHYYALFSFPAFVIAELAWTANSQKVRWSVWLAFAGGFLPLVASWPFLVALKTYYGTNFWGRPTFTVIMHAYDGLFGTSVLRVLPGLGFIVAAALSVVAILAGPFYESSNHNVEKTQASYESLLTVGLLSVPFVAFAATSIGHGVLTGRYLLSMVLGVAIAASYVLRPIRGRRKVLLGLIAIVMVAISWKEVLFWARGRHQLANSYSSASPVIKLLTSVAQADLPFVVSDGQAYVELAYYAPTELAKHLLVLVDPPNAVKFAGNDSVDRGILALRCCVALNVYQYEDFAPEYPKFLLYSGRSTFDWWPARLRKDGYLLETVASDQNGDVYMVNRSPQLH